MSDDEELLSTLSDSMDSDSGFDQDCSEEEDDIPIIGTGSARCALKCHKLSSFCT